MSKGKPFQITKGRAPDVENFRARDVEFALKGRVEPPLLRVLCGLAEKNHHLEKALAEIATMQAQLITIVSQFSDVANNMKDKMQSIEKSVQGEDVGDNKIN